MKTWGVLELIVQESAADLAAVALFDLATTGIENFEASPGGVGLRAYFAGPVPEEAIGLVQAACGADSLIAHAVSLRDDEDWAENWKLHFRAQSIGKSLFICPPWETSPPAGRIAIVIEPGMAFGTGQHATTRGCLVLLEELLEGSNLPLAADIGTGSGILAIAMAKLGVERVHAVDNDPDALRVAAENALANAVDAQVRFGLDLASVPSECPLIVANLFANLLIELAPEFDRRAQATGRIVLSGILEPDVPAVLAAFAAVGWAKERSFDEAPWCAVQLARSTA